MKNPIVLHRVTGEGESLSGSLLRRAFRRLRLPLRRESSIEQTAALNRAERIFEVNFRSTWTR